MKRAVVGGISAATLVAGIAAVGGVATATAAPTPAPRPAATGAGAAGGHGMGLDLAAIKARPAVTAPRTFGAMVAPRAAAAAPASADLSKYALPAGDQGRTNSCVAYATGYTGYGVLMNQQGIPGGPMAPMFTYAQIVKGNDVGTNGDIALALQTKQGIDTKAHYGKGEYDYTSQPNEAELQNALQYKLSGFTALPTSGEEAKAAIKDAIASGSPVAIGMQLHQNFNDIDARTAADYSYRPSGGVIGGHETTIIGYDDKGVKLANSWGRTWGDNGFYTLPWDFVNWGDLVEANAMGRIEGGGPAPAPTTDPTVRPTVRPTVDPTTDPTTDPTVGPTVRPTVVPTDVPTTDPTAPPTVMPTVDPTPDPGTDPWSEWWDRWNRMWDDWTRWLFS